jgi:peptide/nickel transport system substrate-binding protein
MNLNTKHLFQLFGLVIVVLFMLTACQSASPMAVPPVNTQPAAPPAAASANTQAPAAAPTIAPANTQAPTTAPASSAGSGGQIVYCRGFAGPGMNPLVANDIEVWSLFDPLVQLDMKLQARPALAKSWDISTDGKTYTFHMNPSAKWSDGQPVTAQDVIFTFDKIADTKINAINRGSFGPMDSWSAPDDQTVVFKLKSPALPFIWAIAQQRIVPKHILENATADEINSGSFNRAPTATDGPFTYVSGTLDGDLVLGKNANYYLPQGSNDYRFTPYLDRLVFRSVPDTNTILLKLRSGDCDTWALTMDEDTYKSVKQIPGLTVNTIPVGITTRLMVNTQSPLFSDKLVRQAMAYAIDRTSIVSKLLPDVVQLANTEIDPSLPGYDASVKGIPYDPTKAKALLQQSGWTPGPDGILTKNGTKFSFSCDVPSSYPEGPVVQQDLKAVGIDMQMKNADWAQMLTTRYTTDFLCNYTDPGWDNFPDRRYRWYSTLIPPNGQNYAHYQNPALDKVLDAAYLATSIEAAKPYYAQMQQILADEVPDIPMYHSFMTIVADSKLVGYDIGPIYYTDTACKWKVVQ